MVSTTLARALLATNIADNTVGAIDAGDVRAVFSSAFDAIDAAAVKSGASVKDHGAAGDGINNDSAAIVLAMATGSTFLPAGTYRVNANLTISGVVYFSPGAMIKPASGVVITFSGQIVAPRLKIFDTSLGGSFVTAAAETTATPITRVYPEWWGATGYSGGNQSPYLQAAINFIQGTSGGTMYLQGWYRCHNTLFITGRIRIEGVGPVYGMSLTHGGIALSTTLDFSDAATNVGAFLVQNGSTFVNGFQMINVGVFRNPPEPKTATSVGLHLVAVNHVHVVHCNIFGFAIGLQIDDNVNAQTTASYDGIFQGCHIGGGGRAAAIIGGCAAFSFHDTTLYTGATGLDQIVLIGRGIGGMKADTITFADCRIIYLNANASGRPQVLVRITDGMWINFCRTDIEEAAETGILVQRDATANHQDIGLKAIDVSNCWFNACGRAVVFSGFRAAGRISDCRIENSSGGTSNIAVEFTSLVDADIVIRGNNIRASGTSGGIVVGNASGVRITENYVYGDGAGASAPGILLSSTTHSSMVIGNRVRSNHAGPISNAGTNNVVASNVTSVV